eukprot:GEMP01010839.1.p1 GENE.GEMP01010839.1~~GEMP01010839.1.p1  ORF type:complete len:639 (+),score=126.65 GEMP01010839.1:177-2093(+)
MLHFPEDIVTTQIATYCGHGMPRYSSLASPEDQLGPPIVTGTPPSSDTADADAYVNANPPSCPVNTNTEVSLPSSSITSPMHVAIAAKLPDVSDISMHSVIDDSANNRVAGPIIRPPTSFPSPGSTAEAPDASAVKADLPEHSGGCLHRDGSFAQARFYHPRGICFNAHDNCIYVADSSNHCIRRVDIHTDMVTTVAGFSNYPGHRDGAVADAKFNFPCSISASPDGSLYVCDFASHTIRHISADLNHVSTVAGAVDEAGFVDGAAIQSRFRHPVSVVVALSAGFIFISDHSNHAIRRLCLRTHAVDTIAGTGTPGFAAKNTVGEEAQFYYPHGLAWDHAADGGRGALYVADSCNRCVRQLVFQEGAGYYEVRVIAGTGFAGYADGPALEARFEAPVALACSPNGSLCILDEVNCNVRVLGRLPILPEEELFDAQRQRPFGHTGFRLFVRTVSINPEIVTGNKDTQDRCSRMMGGGLAIVADGGGLLMTDFSGHRLLRFGSCIRLTFANLVINTQVPPPLSSGYLDCDIIAEINEPMVDSDDFSVAGHSDSTRDCVDDASDVGSDSLLDDDELFEEEEEEEGPRRPFSSRGSWNGAKIELLEREVDSLRARFAMMMKEMELLKQDNRELKRAAENEII